MQVLVGLEFTLRIYVAFRYRRAAFEALATGTFSGMGDRPADSDFGVLRQYRREGLAGWGIGLLTGAFGFEAIG